MIRFQNFYFFAWKARQPSKTGLHSMKSFALPHRSYQGSQTQRLRSSRLSAAVSVVWVRLSFVPCSCIRRHHPISGRKKHAQVYKFQRQGTLQACRRYLPQKPVATCSGTKGSGNSQSGLQARGSCAAPDGHGLTNMPHKDATAGGRTLTERQTRFRRVRARVPRADEGNLGDCIPAPFHKNLTSLSQGLLGGRCGLSKLGCLRVATTSDVILHYFERGVYEEAVIARDRGRLTKNQSPQVQAPATCSITTATPASSHPRTASGGQQRSPSKRWAGFGNPREGCRAADGNSHYLRTRTVKRSQE